MTATLPAASWTRTERSYPQALLHEAVAAQVERSPSAPAIRFRDEVLTYAEFDARVEQWVGWLQQLGLTRGSLVATCLHRSIEMVVALHAIMRAGGAYVPIDPDYPDARIASILDDLDRPLLLTHQRLAARFTDVDATVVAIDAAPEPAVSPSTYPVPVSPADLAYVIYTSGSTGRPKGAMIPHRAIANRMYWLQEHFGLTPADRVLQKTPYSFDPSVWELFWPLMIGAEIIVAEPRGHRDSAYLARAIVEHGITTVHFVPSVLRLFLEDPRSSECTSLRRVICSGEPLTKALEERFFERFDAELHNLYGPAEAIGVTAWTCRPGSPLSYVPIGRPVANTQLHILDEHLEPVPAGTAGELFIGGVQVATGYLNRPALTAERFLPDPFLPGGKLYRSGDLVRCSPDGILEFLGRTDLQVKIRGNRVEPGEIEAELESIAGVNGAVVVAHERSDGELVLAAYLTHAQGVELGLDAVRAHLAARLPEYMIPATFVTLECFPLNANGKVDRQALPSPLRVRPRLGPPYVAPRSQLQRDIAARWCRILEIDRVGIHDRFFELGGTSLQAARFVNEMQAELEQSIYVVSLFDAPSVAEYAAFLEQTYPSAVAGYLGVERGGVVANGAPEAPTERSRTRSGSRRSLSRQLARRRAARGQERV